MERYQPNYPYHIINRQYNYVIPQQIQSPYRVPQGEDPSSNRSRLSQDVIYRKLSPNFAPGPPIKKFPHITINYGSRPISNLQNQVIKLTKPRSQTQGNQIIYNNDYYPKKPEQDPSILNSYAIKPDTQFPSNQEKQKPMDQQNEVISISSQTSERKNQTKNQINPNYDYYLKKPEKNKKLTNSFMINSENSSKIRGMIQDSQTNTNRQQIEENTKEMLETVLYSAVRQINSQTLEKQILKKGRVFKRNSSMDDNQQNIKGQKYELKQLLDGVKYTLDANQIATEQSLKILNNLKQMFQNYFNLQVDNQNLQPRFRKIPHVHDPQNQEKSLITLCGKTFSFGFNLLKTGEFTIQKLKAYCSKQIIKYLMRMIDENKNKKVDPDFFKNVNRIFKEKIAPYFGALYPQTQQSGISSKLCQTLIERNSLDDNRYDYIYRSGIKFRLNQERGDYNTQIMTFLNYVISLSETKVPYMSKSLSTQNNQNETIRQSFHREFSQFFKLVQSESKKINMLRFNPKKPGQILVQQEHVEKTRAEQQQYAQKVRSYTTFEIGEKLKSNSNLFSKYEVQSGNLRLKNPEIERVITKWCEQLWDWFSESKMLQKMTPFRMKDGSERYLKKFHLKVLNKMLQRERLLMKEGFKKEMEQSFYRIQSQLIDNYRTPEELKDFQKYEVQLGYFAASLIKINQAFLIQYLNKLIASLNKVSEMFGNFQKVQKQHHAQLSAFDMEDDTEIQFQKLQEKVLSYLPFIQDTSQNPHETPQLITFKISDLLRCSCTSKQMQIVALYKQLERINYQSPKRLKIIQIKNKLHERNKDILIKILYKQTMTVQLQLAIKSDKTKQIQYSNKFNHFFYEIQRSQFGPISEMCKIWMAHDQKLAQFYSKKFLQITKKNQRTAYNLYDSQTNTLMHNESKKIKERELKKKTSDGIDKGYHFENNCFKCSNCNYFYTDYSAFKIKYQNQETVCFLCHIQIIDPKDSKIKALLPSLTFNQKIIFENITFKKQIPLNGGALLELRDKKPKAILFRVIHYNNRYYLFEVKIKDNQKSLKLIQEFDNLNLSHRFLSYNLIFSSPEIQNEIPTLTKEQAQVLYFLPQILINADEKQLEVISFTKKIKFFENNFSHQQLSNKVWPSVKKLNFSENRIKTLNIFPVKFPNIEYLRVYDNSIRFIEKQTLKKWNKIKYLYLSKNLIQDISSITEECTELVQLDLSKNHLKNLPTSIQNLKKLQLLNISSCKIKFIPQQIGCLSQLATLHLNRNLMIQLPQSFSKLTKLKKLFLQKNQFLQSLPSSFHKLESLKFLKIYDNAVLKGLPQKMGYLPNLEVLIIQNNFTLKQLPKTICMLKSLQTLIISWNKNLQKLPEQFDVLKNLRKLEIIQNPSLKALPAKIANLTQLQNLTTSYYPNTPYQSILNSLKNTKTFIKNFSNKSPIQTPEIANLFKFLKQKNSVEQVIIQAMTKAQQQISKIERQINKGVENWQGLIEKYIVEHFKNKQKVYSEIISKKCFKTSKRQKINFYQFFQLYEDRKNWRDFIQNSKMKQAQSILNQYENTMKKYKKQLRDYGLKLTPKMRQKITTNINNKKKSQKIKTDEDKQAYDLFQKLGQKLFMEYGLYRHSYKMQDEFNNNEIRYI